MYCITNFQYYKNDAIPAWAGLGWNGLEWAGLAWAGLGWPEVAWAGLGWPGLAWVGLGWPGLTRANDYCITFFNALHLQDFFFKIFQKVL